MTQGGTPRRNAIDYGELARCIKRWGTELGFQQVGIADIDLAEDEHRLAAWLSAGMHGEMGYMARHGTRRSRPEELVPGTVRAISARMDYLPTRSRHPLKVLNDPERAYVARYAMGRDYHKVLRGRLRQLARRIERAVGPHGARVFSDSAPVLEKALGRNANLGWIGKHTCLIHPRAGSWFFLGEIYTDLPLPADPSFAGDHCGSCTACIRICPTGAIIGSRRLDARRCISYLTIELHGPIPVELRPLIGNRVFGCDDCQLICPWNKFARRSVEPDFAVRHGLDNARLTELFAWSEEEFLRRTEGSPIRRTGYLRWLRNLAVGLGNGPASAAAVAALNRRRHHSSELVREHVEWALTRISPGNGPR